MECRKKNKIMKFLKGKDPKNIVQDDTAENEIIFDKI